MPIFFFPLSEVFQSCLVQFPVFLCSLFNYFNFMSVETFRSVPVLPCRIPSVLVSSLNYINCILSKVSQYCLVEFPVFLCPLFNYINSMSVETFRSVPVLPCTNSRVLVSSLNYINSILSEVSQYCLVEFPVFLCPLFNYINSMSVETFRSVPVLPCRIPSVLVSSLQLL